MALEGTKGPSWDHGFVGWTRGPSWDHGFVGWTRGPSWDHGFVGLDTWPFMGSQVCRTGHMELRGVAGL